MHRNIYLYLFILIYTSPSPLLSCDVALSLTLLINSKWSSSSSLYKKEGQFEQSWLLLLSTLYLPPRRFLVAPPGKDTVWFTSILLVWGSTLNCCNPSVFGSKLVSLSLFGMVFFPENKLQENIAGKSVSERKSPLARPAVVFQHNKLLSSKSGEADHLLPTAW